MTAVARFDLKMDAEEMGIVSRAAALVGMTTAEFVRAAAIEKAHVLLDCEFRASLSPCDFQAFTAALDRPFSPNAALKSALTAARKIKRA